MQRIVMLSGLPPDEVSDYVPDVVCGDLDSVAGDAAKFYAARGSTVLSRPDQGTKFVKLCRWETILVCCRLK
jgi:thiamine pyrophosphokinase